MKKSRKISVAGKWLLVYVISTGFSFRRSPVIATGDEERWGPGQGKRKGAGEKKKHPDNNIVIFEQQGKKCLSHVYFAKKKFLLTKE